jgi:hypothetical protein
LKNTISHSDSLKVRPFGQLYAPSGEPPALSGRRCATQIRICSNILFSIFSASIKILKYKIAQVFGGFDGKAYGKMMSSLLR